MEFRTKPFLKAGAGIALYSPGVSAENVGDDQAVKISLAQVVEPSGEDDTDAINAVLAAGNSVALVEGGQYYISSQIEITSDNTGILGNFATITVSRAAGHFDNDVYADRRNANAVPIYANGRTNIYVKQCRITPDVWQDCLYLKPIFFDGCTDFEISENEIWNFSRGRGMITVRDSSLGWILDNYIHDCYTQSVYESDGSTPATAATVQVTAIELADDASVESHDIIIDRNIIEDITYSGDILTSLGAQSDGINGLGTNAVQTYNLVVTNNIIRNTGEAVDLFGRDLVVTGNIIERAFGAGIKVIHGGSRVMVAHNSIRESGLCGILLSGSTSATIDADRITCSFNVISRVNCATDTDGSTPLAWLEADGVTAFYEGNGTTTYWSNVFNSGSGTSTAGVRVNVITSQTSDVTNATISHNIMDLGGNADFGVFAEGTAGGSATIYCRENFISGYETGPYGDATNYLIVDGGRPITKTADFTVADRENRFICNGAGTIAVTLPTASRHPGRSIYIKTIAAQAVNSVASDVKPLATNTAGTAILANTAGKWTKLVSDGAHWIAMEGN